MEVPPDAPPLAPEELATRLRSYEALLSQTLAPLVRAQRISLAASSSRRAAASERATCVAALLRQQGQPPSPLSADEPLLVDLGGGWRWHARLDAPLASVHVALGAGGVSLEMPLSEAAAYMCADVVRAADDEARRAGELDRVAGDLQTAFTAVLQLRQLAGVTPAPHPSKGRAGA